MIEELNRRLDAIDGYIDCINQRTQQNMPELTPPNPNRLIRREIIAKQIEESLFSPNLEELHNSIPSSYASPEYVRQLIENDKDDYVDHQPEKFMLDKSEYTTIMAERNSRKAIQNL